MTFNTNTVELLAEWCLRDDSLVDVRTAARRDFFGYDEPGEAHYLDGVGDVISRERRFMGWFALTFKLADGRSPAELAATAILIGSDLTTAIDSIKRSRYVLAMVAMVNPGRGLTLKLEDEEFTINNRYLSRVFTSKDAVSAHILPAGRRGWLVGPGWVQWPIRIMPGMEANLKKFQLSPIDLERFLQQRKKSSEAPLKEMPRDSSLEAAVARMTEAANSEGRLKLIMTTNQWKELVIPYLSSGKHTDFIQVIVNLAGKVKSTDEINRWLGLAMNIWNNTPQPDRGGKSPYEMSQEYNIQSAG
jgi:hypothetical protein